MSTSCSRVPVHTGHSVSMTIEFEKPMNAAKAKNLLNQTIGIKVMNDENYITPREAEGSDTVFINRLRDDNSAPNSITMLVVADNLRKGAATNIV